MIVGHEQRKTERDVGEDLHTRFYDPATMRLVLLLSFLHPCVALLAGLGLTAMPSRVPFGRQQETVATASPPRVQRQYETWTWKSNYGVFQINYRVDGPEDGTPILLTHGFGVSAFWPVSRHLISRE